MPPCWPAPLDSSAQHGRAVRRGIPVPNLWNFRATLSDHFCDFKLVFLALLFANYQNPFIYLVELLKLRKDVE